MMLWRAAVLWGVLVLLPGVSVGGEAPVARSAARVVMDVPEFPVDGFGEDSARITHPYFPLRVGDSLAWSGFGSWSGDLRLYTAAAVELVDGVQCLRVMDEDLSSGLGRDENGEVVRLFIYSRVDYWLAQDGNGNVWLLKVAIWDSELGAYSSETTFGAVEPWPELWNNIAPGDTWTFVDGGVGQVVSLSAKVDPLRTGAGPYEGCLHTRETFQADLLVDRFYAPGVGLVREVFSLDGVQFGYNRVPQVRPEPGFGILEFGSDGYSAREEDGSFPATVVRSRGSEGVVAVEFEVTAATLTFLAGPDDFDFFVDWKILFLAPGQTHLTFDVAVHDNEIWNNRTTLEIQLSNAGFGAELGARTFAEVFVEEAESGSDGGTFIGPCFIDSLGLW